MGRACTRHEYLVIVYNCVYHYIINYATADVLIYATL
jgi:hypothetical protein